MNRWYVIFLICIIGLSSAGLSQQSTLSFEDGAGANQSRGITAEERRGVRRWTFDMSSGGEFIDFISGEAGSIDGYGTSIRRVEGHTVTSDKIRTPKALEFNGKAYLSCGPVPEWKSQVNRTMAFYLKKAPGD